MTHPIEKVAVLGAGTMGAAIAAHVANAGLPVLLLDVVPRELSAEEAKRGLSLDHPAVRNRVVREGFERIRKLKPASFMSPEAEQLVTLGNLDDDFHRLADCDWIVEAVVERLDVKRALVERLEAVRKPTAIITTNTSGLPIASITEGRNESLRQCFFGTHFFNPPRYMKLLEVIAGDADPAAVGTISDFASRRLGKGVVPCKDTPNFIANRILSVHASYLMHTAFEQGYRIEEVDAVTGPLIGRPKTATFRLQDLVGVDVAHFVAQNLYDLIPDDPHREVLRSPHLARVIGGLVERGWLGNKSGQGFYKKVKGKGGESTFLVLDPASFEYGEPQEVRFEAVGAVRKIPDLGARLRALFDPRWDGDRAARFTWSVIGHFLAYAAACAPEVAYDLASIDRAVRWGFGYEVGPFELWDALGVDETASRLEASGHDVAPWVREMLTAGGNSFYRRDDGRATAVYDWSAHAYAKLASDPREIRVEALPTLESNASASLHDLGKGVLLLELHSKMNAIDQDVIAMVRRARERLDEDAWVGLVIGNDGENFSVGANLKLLGELAQTGDVAAIAEVPRALQEALQALRYAPKPTVAAVHAMALGGGCEIALGAHRIVAAAESYLGMVEAGAGLLPAGGGLKEMVLRRLSPPMENPENDPLPLAREILETIGMAKTSTSAAEAAGLGFLGAHDRVAMNRDHLLYEARAEVLAMVAASWTPPPRARLYAGGRDLFAALKIGVWSLRQAGFASDHDALVAEKIAWVIAGGDLSAAEWVDEDYFLALERQGFAELAVTEKTQARIRHLLETGKPLRN